MSIIKCIKRCILQHHRGKHKHNPFRDVKILHQDTDSAEFIVVSFDCTEELDPFALEETIAELIAAELVKTHCISIVKTTTYEDSSITYTGRIAVLDENKMIFIN